MRKTLKILNRCIICLLLMMILGLLSTEAEAFSLQLRGGVGIIPSEEDAIENGTYRQGGLDIFIYEGRYVALFVGGEYLDSSEVPLYEYDYYSFEIIAATFGIRLKPAMRGRWKPYLSLGGIGGRVDKGKRTQGKDSDIFAAYRAGLGTDIGVGERFSIGIEANITRNYTVLPNLMGLNLGLRYYF